MKTNFKPATVESVKEIVSVLNEQQQQLLKDTINKGYWGDSTAALLNEDGNVEDTYVEVYITNDAKLAGNFTGRQVSAMFRGVYSKLCPKKEYAGEGLGHYISHQTDWWGDGSGDCLFIRGEYEKAFRQWAKE